MIYSQVFDKKLLLNTLCAYLFSFLFSQSRLVFYSIYSIMALALQNRCAKFVINTFQKKNVKKFRNYLLNEKNCIKLFLEQDFFVSIKRQLCLTRRHLGNQEGKMEVKYLPHRKLFLILLIQIKKKNYFKKATFNKALDPQMLYLSKVGPVKEKRKLYV